MEMQEWAKTGILLYRDGTYSDVDLSYQDISEILSGAKANNTAWTYKELEQIRNFKLELPEFSEKYGEFRGPVEFSKDNIMNFLHNPANQIMTKDDLINALVKVFKMTISEAENITGLGNIEGNGRIVYGDVVLNNIEELQNDLIKSGKDIGDILKKSDTEIYAKTGLTREYVEEAKRMKKAKIDNLAKYTTDWESLKANNDSGLAYNDILYAERLQKEKNNSYTSKDGDVSKNEKWSAEQVQENELNAQFVGPVVSSSKSFSELTEIIKSSMDSDGRLNTEKLFSGLNEQEPNNFVSTISEDVKDIKDVVTAGSYIESLISPLSTSSKIEIGKPVNIALSGEKINKTNYPVATSLFKQQSQNVTNNNGNINVFVSKGTNLPAIQYASTLEHTNKQDNLV